MEDVDGRSLVAEFADDSSEADDSGEADDCSEADDSSELERFIKPIICNVIVNGKTRKMAFSWEHFITLAFVLKDSLQLDSEDKEEY